MTKQVGNIWPTPIAPDSTYTMSAILCITVQDREGSVLGTLWRTAETHVIAVARYQDTYRHEALEIFKTKVPEVLIRQWVSESRGTITIGSIWVESDPDFFSNGRGRERVTDILASKVLVDEPLKIAMNNCHDVKFGIVFH